MSILYLTGIIETGETRDPVLPRSTATAVAVTVGETTELRCRVFRASGAAVAIAALPSWSAQLNVNCTVDPCQTVPDFKFAGALATSDPLGNLLVFTVPTATFRGKTGRLFFDIWLFSETNRWQIIKTSAWRLGSALARP